MRNSILNYIGISFIGGLLGRIFQYLISITIARGLGASSLGMFSIGLVVVRLSSSVSILGLDTAAQKFIPVYEEEDEEALNGFIFLSIISPLFFGALVASGIYTFVSSTNIFQNETTRVVSIFLIGVPFLALLKVNQESLQGFRRADYGTLIKDIIHSGLAVCLILVATYYFEDLTYAVLGFTLSAAVASLAGSVLLGKLGLSSLTEVHVEYKRIYTYSLPVLVSAIGYPLIMWSDILILGYLSSSTEVGHYRAAYIIASLIPFVLFAINTVFPPLASKFYDNNNQKQLKGFFHIITKWLVSIVLIELVFIYTFSADILSIFGQSFTNSTNYLYILAFAQGVATVVGPVGFLLTMTNFERVEALNMGIAAGVNVVLNFVLISRYGPIGAAVATATTITLLNITRVGEVWRLLDIPPYSIAATRGLIPAIILFPVLTFVSQLSLLPISALLTGGISSGIIFLIIAYLLVYKPEDQMLLEAI